MSRYICALPVAYLTPQRELQVIILHLVIIGNRFLPNYFFRFLHLISAHCPSDRDNYSNLSTSSAMSKSRSTYRV